MFIIFRKQSPQEKLNKQYEILITQSHSLSNTNRTFSDKKYADVQEVLKQFAAYY